MQKICVSNGKIWEKAELHLKSAVSYDSSVAKQIELEMLIAMI